MKKKRRVELHIEHREISLYVGPGGLVGKHSAPAIPSVSGLQRVRPEACPDCGSSDLQLLTEFVSSVGIDLATLQRGMENGSVHLHRSPDGEWWVCAESLRSS
jgi:hypothetical protein